MYATRQPYQVYTDKSGKPLDNGKLYFGLANQDPETYPQAVFWDAAGTIPAAQPIRTLGGYPVYNGSPAIVYCNNFYSVTSRDQNGVFQYTFPDSSVYDTPTSVAGSNVFSAKNLLINASFTVSQRVYVSGTPTAAPNRYTLDRWKVITGGQSVTYTASGADFNVVAPSGGLEQIIESSLVGGGVYTISWEGTAQCRVNGAVVTNGQNVTLPAGVNASVSFNNGSVLRPQLELSPQKTQFERLGFAQELLRCQRYFQKSFDYTVAPANTTSTNGSFRVKFFQGVTGAFAALGTVQFKATMRVPPTVTLFNPVNAAAVNPIRNFGAASDLPGIANNIGDGAMFVFVNNSSLTGGADYELLVHYTLDAEL